MAQFNFTNAQEYANESSGLFSLRNDGDTARVRILVDKAENINGTWTHWLKVGGKGRHVACLAQNPNDGKEVHKQQCPICRFGTTSREGKKNVRFFIPMLNLDTDEYVLWERGINLTKNQSFIKLLQEHPKELYKQVVEITRIGEQNDNNTDYHFEVITSSVSYSRVDGSLSEFEVPDPIESGLLLDKTYDELEFYYTNGHFEGDNSSEDGIGSYRRRERDSSDGYYSRRNSNSQNRYSRDNDEDLDDEDVAERPRGRYRSEANTSSGFDRDRGSRGRGGRSGRREF